MRCSSGSRAGAGKSRAIADDAGVDRLVRQFAGKPLFLGLRADDRGWATAITPKALAKVDFVLLDGETLAAAVPGTAADPQAYGDALAAATVAALAGEPVDVYGAPFFLPATRAAQRDAIWTEARQQQVLDAAVANHVAIEINGALKLPGEAFVRKAKSGGREVHARTLRGGHAGRRVPASASARPSACRGATCTEPGHQPTRGARPAN